MYRNKESSLVQQRFDYGNLAGALELPLNFVHSHRGRSGRGRGAVPLKSSTERGNICSMSGPCIVLIPMLNACKVQ